MLPISHKETFSADLLSQASRKFCLLYVEVERFCQQRPFRIKPKMHMWQELCEMHIGTRPSLYWTYRDEDFGGTLARMSRRRGGRSSLRSVGNSVLDRFAGKHDVPDLAKQD